MDVKINDQEAPSNEMKPRGMKTGETQPGWVAEYHGSISQNGSSLLFNPRKKQGEGSCRSSLLGRNDISEWMSLRVSKLPTDVNSKELNLFLREVSESPEPTGYTTMLTTTTLTDVKMSCTPLSVKIPRDRLKHSRGQAILTFENWEIGESIQNHQIRDVLAPIHEYIPLASRVLRKLQGVGFRGEILDLNFEHRNVRSASSQVDASLCIEGDAEPSKVPSCTSDSGGLDGTNSAARASVADQHGLPRADNLVHRAIQTDATLASIDAGSQTEPAAYIAVGCQTAEVGWTRSTGCQTEPNYEHSSAGTQTDQVSTIETTSMPARSAGPCSDLAQKWSALPLLDPDSFSELVLYPAESVWAYLFRCSNLIRKTFKIRQPDEEMQALSLDWLASRDVEEVRARLKSQLAKLLRVSVYFAYQGCDVYAEASRS